MLNSVRIVLVGTTHSGNIGAAARAMGNMGLSRLYLVDPRDFPSPVATARASGADHILEGAVVCKTLAEALDDCVYVAGTTARPRESTWPVFEPTEMVARLASESGPDHLQVALVFGQERSGLTNKELDLCDALVTVPVDPAFPSLNLGAAVMLMSWELRKHCLNRQPVMPTNLSVSDPPASSQEMESYFEHLQEVLMEMGFIKFNKPEKLMRKIRHLFMRSRPTSEEVNLLRGIFSSAQYHVRQNFKKDL